MNMTPANSDKGIVITAPEQYKKGDDLMVEITFRVNYPGVGIPEEPSKIPNHIALIVTHYTSYTSCKPFYDMVLFDDDVNYGNNICEGKFKLNVSNHIPFESDGKFEILVSLGTCLSNTIKTTSIVV